MDYHRRAWTSQELPERKTLPDTMGWDGKRAWTSIDDRQLRVWTLGPDEANAVLAGDRLLPVLCGRGE